LGNPLAQHIVVEVAVAVVQQQVVLVALVAEVQEHLVMQTELLEQRTLVAEVAALVKT